MSMLQLPSTSKGVLIALGIVAVIIVFFYAGTLLTVLLGAILVALILYTVYIVGRRIHGRLLKTKPWKIGRDSS